MATNPYAPPVVQNPYANWSTWRQPQDEAARQYYTNSPREPYELFSSAWGSPNGNLQKFFQSQFGNVWAEYMRQTEDPTKLDLQFSDTLDRQLGDRMQAQWQAQTPYQRGENYQTMSAGRMT